MGRFSRHLVVVDDGNRRIVATLATAVAFVGAVGTKGMLASARREGYRRAGGRW